MLFLQYKFVAHLFFSLIIAWNHSKKDVQKVLQQITLLQNRNKTLEKQKTKEMKKMLQNVINRYKILDDTIKAQYKSLAHHNTRYFNKECPFAT